MTNMHQVQAMSTENVISGEFRFNNCITHDYVLFRKHKNWWLNDQDESKQTGIF